MKRALSIATWVGVAWGCAALEADPNPPGVLPHGGTGEFRPLSAEETGIRGTPTGRALPVRDALDSASVAAGHLFYAAAVLPDTAPEPTADPVPNEVIWSDFEPRRIHRSAPTERPGFFIGDEVLAASQPWQGPAVYEPWVLVLDDGRALLYYAAAGGIGLAEASAVDAVFAPVGDGPVLDAGAGAVAPRRPSAVWHAGRVLLYYDAGGALGLATSADGRAFERVTDALPLGPDLIEDGSREVAVGAPGAMVAVTPTGREVVRLYFESHRDDGRRLVSLAASLDGERFERFERPVVDEDDRRLPAPVAVDARTTLLYVMAPREQSGREVRALVAAVAPRSATF
jgi:hypothetical protein